MLLNDYLASSLIGKKIRFTCDCIMNLNITGRVKDYTLMGPEILWIVDTGSKIVKVGSNTPDLQIEIL